VIACHLRYVVNTAKLREFEAYARVWITLVNRFGGRHLGYLMPSEGASNIALATFTFPSFAAYEEYRKRAATDADCQAAVRYADAAGCIISFERSFFRPVADGLAPDALGEPK
jgi:NIPSNAP protein